MNIHSRSGQANKATVWFIVGFLVLVTAAVIIAGAYSSGTDTSATPASTFVSTSAPAISAADHKTGDTASKVSVIEYGDYECPACGQYYPVVKQLITDYGSRVEFVFRNFPLYTVHPNAGISAQAAEAAGLQGKYWQMYDELYTNQATWGTADTTKVVGQYFDGYAASIGLNVAQFDKDITSSAVMNKIQADVDGGNAASIDHTPTFFVNLKQIPNPQSYTEFKTAIDAALADANGVSTTTTSTAGTSVQLITTTSTAK